MTPTLWFFVAGGVVVICLVVCDAIARKQHRDRFREIQRAEKDEARREKLALSSAKATAKMDRHGIRSLLNGHKGWATVNPMSAPVEPAKVVQLKAKRR